MAATYGNCGWAILAVGLAAVLGCGSSQRATAYGNVTLDGKPMEAGAISFVPLGANPESKPAWSKVEGGEYAIPAKAGLATGEFRVEIRWIRKTGRKWGRLPDPNGDELAEAIPERYNSQSELKPTIKPGENHLDFELKSK